MGFWSTLGKIGKWAAVPALAATGVGIPAAVAIGAGLSAADTKLRGGSWKDAALSGALGGATSAIPGVGGAVSGAAAKTGANVASTGLKSVLAQTGKQLLTDPNTYAAVGGALAKGMQGGREAENVAAQQTTQHQVGQQAAAERALMDRAAVDLRRREFAQGSQNNNYKNALASSL